MQMPASIGQIRLTSGSRLVPIVACQTLVISAGATMIAAACAGVIIRPEQTDRHRRQAEPDHALDEARQQKGPRRSGKHRI